MHDLIKFFTLDDDFLTQYAADSGDFVGSAKAVETILANGGTPNPAAALANGSLMSEYDADINDLWDKFVTTPYTKGEIENIDDAIASFKDQVKTAISTITVE